MTLDTFLSQLPNAIVSAVNLTGLYVLVGLAWVIIFRATKIPNFSSGQFIVLAAYMYFVFNVRLALPWWVSFAAAVLGMGLVGYIVMRGLMTRMIGVATHAIGHAPAPAVFLTFGLAEMLSSAVRAIFGPSTYNLDSPIPAGVIRLGFGNTIITNDRIFIWVLAIVMLLLTLFIIRYTKFGTQMRASAEQPILAAQSGINVHHIFIIGWVTSAVLCALAGIGFAFSSVVSPSLGNVGLRALAPAIVGGIDSAAGVLPGALIVALVENVMVLLLGESVRDAAVMSVIMVMLIFRPNGLFGHDDTLRRV